MQLPSIPRSSSRLADEVYERLVDALVERMLKPGDRLIQDRLADELQVSRTPVREALLRLQQEGVIAPAERRGFVVCAVSQEEITQIYGAREAIEAYAARTVASQGAAAVSAAASRLDAAARLPITNAGTAFEANRLTHRAIVEVTGNAILLDLFDSVWNRTLAARSYAQALGDEVTAMDVAAEHADILNALKSGSPDKAEQVMVAHIRDGLSHH